MESVGFKEWALVCDALGRGEQSIILRKGGIAEGRDGFAFRHREFFLFPTFFHEQLGKVRGEAAEIPPRCEGKIEITLYARVDLSAVITDWQRAVGLEQFHILRSDVVRERFEYDDAPGIHVAFVRVYRLASAWVFADAPKYGGCRSWVALPSCPDRPMAPVLSTEEHARRLEEFRARIGG